MKTKLPDEVTQAIENAKRTPGWNNRSRDVHRFELGACTLYVVPFRRWAYRRQELATAAYWRAQGKPQGTAA
jgi:hypothetical protein